MTQTAGEIIDEIEGYRSHLGEDLTTLESRVRDATTWRTYYDRNPYLFVGTAFGGGLLLSAMFGGRRRATGHFREAQPKDSSYQRVEHSRTGLSQSIDEIKTALIGYGMSKVMGIMGEILPGFAEHAK